MMRALWTASTGMTAQQLNVDSISNNLANVNTTAFKKENLEFKSLLYETMQRADQDPGNIGSRPLNLQVGHGVTPIATYRNFSMGNLENTMVPTDFAISGDGFFIVDKGNDNIAYTKDGSFKVSISGDDEFTLVTSDGYPILNTDYEPITIPNDVKLDSISVDKDGVFTYVDEEGNVQNLDIQLGLVQFSNKQGLEAVGSNLFEETPASGEAIMEAEEDIPNKSVIYQRYLERSNVQVADEMVNLIVAQRAYELNSKAVQTADDMLQQANNLKR